MTPFTVTRYTLTKIGGEIWLAGLDKITDYGRKYHVIEAKGEQLLWFGCLWFGWKFWYTLGPPQN